jgi:hypothetical protein
MKLFATPQSSVAISVTWTYDSGDEVPASVIIREYGPDGALMASQPNPQPVAGVALFVGLKPATTYRYEWCGIFPSSSGDLTSCHPQSPALGTTFIQKPPPPPPHGPPSGPSSTPSSGVVVKVRAIPFGKIAVEWGSTAGDITAVVRFRDASTNGNVPLPRTKVASLADTGPFDISAVYSYQVYSYFNGNQIGVAYSNAIAYPAWLGLREFLPANFNPAQGIKRLLPNDHPFVSVRKIMSGN